MTKGPILQKIWDDLPAERKALIETRTHDLLAEYLTLLGLHKAVGLTQHALCPVINPKPGQ